MTLQKIAIGMADSVMMIFCHSGRALRKATATATVMNVISDRSPAHASATLSVRIGSVMLLEAMLIFVPLRNAVTPVKRSVTTATFAASSWSGLAMYE